MGSGDVLNFSNRTFSDFFKDFNIDIFDTKYVSHGPSGSKANCLRAFWKIEPNELVAQVLEDLLHIVETQKTPPDIKTLENGRMVIKNLSNLNIKIPDNYDSIRFLQKTFKSDFIATNIVTPKMAKVLNRRLKEVSECIDGSAFLATVIMAGSLLEGLLIELANKNMKIFNQSPCSPKNREGCVKKFYDWTLEELINVAYDTEFISADMKKFSSSLRDFRNYIHPQEQVKFNFHPDEHTAIMAMQVLKAEIADISNERASTTILSPAT